MRFRSGFPFLAVALFGLADSSCRVFSKVEDCKVDEDCGGVERCNPDGKFCEKLTQITIGVMVGKTGALASQSANVLKSLDYAAATINESGGVLGTPIVLEVLDDEGADDLAEANARAFVARNVVGVIGPMRSAQVLRAQAPIYQAKILQIVPLAGAGALAASQPPRDRYLFQTITSIRRGSSSAIVRYASKPIDEAPRPDPPCTKMAVFHTDDVTGKEYYEAIAALMPKNGGCVTLDVPFPTALKADYVAEVKKLFTAKPECAAMIALPPVGAAILREYDKQKKADTSGTDWSKFRWLGTTTLHTADFLTAARADKAKPTPSFAEGFLGADVDSAPPTAEYSDFRFGFREYFATNDEPPNLSSNAFDALVLMALSIEHAGSAHDRVAIRDSLFEVARDGDRVPAFGPATVGEALRAAGRKQRINYQGASGGIEPDDTGVVINPTLIWKVEKGEFSPTILRYTEAQTKAVDDVRVQPRTCP
jgi:ABC-type branched-subunit amino acid transport system substrate-binding protein